MKIIIEKFNYKSVLFVFSFLVLILNNYELTFFVWTITALSTLQFKYSIKFLKFVSYCLFIMIIAFFSSFYFQHFQYNFFRDFAYLIKPILGLFIGYNYCKKYNKNPFEFLIKIGILLAIIHLIILFVCYFVYSMRNINDIRHYGGYFSDFEIYALIFLIFYKKFDIQLDKKKYYFYLTILVISTLFYLARTNIIQFFILILALKGFLKLTSRNVSYWIILISVIGISYTAIYQSNPSRTGKGLEAFFYKIKIAPIEAFKTKINKDDWKEFNDNYRSFENIITVKQVTSEGWFGICFGKGMGSTIDIGRQMWTNDGEFIRYVPTLHNAYMTIYLKAGLLGVFSLLLFIYELLKTPKSNNAIIKNINLLFIGSAFFLILSNWVFMGLYLKLDNKAILFGMLICYREFLLKQEKKSIC